MLIEYYFKIQYIKGTKNVRIDTPSKKAKLQNNKKPLGVILHKDKNRLIRYNYPKNIAIKEENAYKALENIQL